MIATITGGVFILISIILLIVGLSSGIYTEASLRSYTKVINLESMMTISSAALLFIIGMLFLSYGLTLVFKGKSIYCEECKMRISSLAKTCPFCRTKIENKSN